MGRYLTVNAIIAVMGLCLAAPARAELPLDAVAPVETEIPGDGSGNGIISAANGNSCIAEMEPERL